MKCDDDTFVNVPNLIHYLLGGTIPVYNATLNFHEDLIKESEMSIESVNRITNYEDLLIGFRFCHAKPIQDSDDKG